jgi:hypothetical protein
MSLREPNVAGAFLCMKRSPITYRSSILDASILRRTAVGRQRVAKNRRDPPEGSLEFVVQALDQSPEPLSLGF